MPGEKASTLRSAGRWIVDVVKVVLGPAMMFLIAYVVHPDFRAWVSQVVGRVGPVLTGAGGLGALAVAGVLLRMVWVAVRRRVMGWYANGVWVVSTPVRDELAVRFLAHYRSASGEYAECRAKVRELSIVEAQVLHYLLVEYFHYPGETLHLWLDDPEVLMSPLKELGRDLVKSACDELVKAGFLAEVKWRERDGGEEMHIVVGKCVVKKSAARRVAGWVDEEMQGQGVWGPF